MCLNYLRPTVTWDLFPVTHTLLFPLFYCGDRVNPTVNVLLWMHTCGYSNAEILNCSCNLGSGPRFKSPMVYLISFYSWNYSVYHNTCTSTIIFYLCIVALLGFRCFHFSGSSSDLRVLLPCNLFCVCFILVTYL